MKLKDDLFVIHNDFVPGNTTVMVTNEGVILVDDKFEIDHANIMAELKKITSQPVKYVINTHHHGDHSGGNAKLQAMGAQVVTSEQARQNMVDGKQPGLPNVTIEQHACLYLGGKRVEVYLLRPRAHQRRHRRALPGAARRWRRATCSRSAMPRRSSWTTPAAAAREWTEDRSTARSGSTSTRSCPGTALVTTKPDMRKFRDSTVRLRTKVHDMIVAEEEQSTRSRRCCEAISTSPISTFSSAWMA